MTVRSDETRALSLLLENDCARKRGWVVPEALSQDEEHRTRGPLMITSLRKRLMNRCASLMRRESAVPSPPSQRPLRCAPVFGPSSPCAGRTARVSAQWLCPCPRSGPRRSPDLGKQATRCAISTTRLGSPHSFRRSPRVISALMHSCTTNARTAADGTTSHRRCCPTRSADSALRWRRDRCHSRSAHPVPSTPPASCGRSCPAGG
jgi:hypothetical protein